MRNILRLVPLVVAACLVAGCFPLSLQPLYMGEGDVIYDPALLGVWQVENEPSDERWEITAVETGDAYIFRTASNGGEIQLRGVLVRVGDRRFLDLYPIGHAPEIGPSFAVHTLPTHSIWRVGIEPGKLRFAVLDNAKTVALLKENPELIEHRFVDMTPSGSGDPRPVFTADSAAFQAFVRDHLDDSYFQNEMVLIKPEE